MHNQSTYTIFKSNTKYLSFSGIPFVKLVTCRPCCKQFNFECLTVVTSDWLFKNVTTFTIGYPSQVEVSTREISRGNKAGNLKKK